MLAEDIQDVLADRTPRHRSTWTPPPPADETLRSGHDFSGARNR
jgi:hypothetical protein